MAKIQIAQNITISTQQHDKLVEHLKDRLEFANSTRQVLIQKFEQIDKEISGYLVLDASDNKRERDNRKGFGVKPTDQKLPLTFAQLDEAVTYLLEVLGADDQLYGAIAPADKQMVATGFTALMNKHADKFKHERHLALFLLNCLRYNFGVCGVDWKQVHGNIIDTGPGSEVTISNGVVYSGNALWAFDMYNFIYDVSVDPIDLPTKGEFFALPCMESPFRVQRMTQTDELFNTADLLKEGSYETNWYQSKPTIRADINNIADSDINWFNILSAGDKTEIKSAIELVNFAIWIDPTMFGLRKSEKGAQTKMEIWRLTLANNRYIVKATHLSNAHGMLPCVIAMPNEDNFRENTKSYAEMLNPWQQFASFQINMHQRAARKSLYGLTFYNKNIVPLGDLDDAVAGQIPVNAHPDYDIGKAVKQITDAPNTSNTMRDISDIFDIMQKILPTDMLRQVAGLERATQFQAAATVQAGNRRNLKMARIIESQALSASKHMQMYNIMQFQETMEILTPDGKLTKVDPKQFRETELEFTISQGLRGLDKMSMIMHIKEIINTIVQNQQALQQIDVVKLINYWSSMFGDHTDFTQFKFESPMDALPPEQKQIAFQLLQQFSAEQQGAETQAAPQQAPV